MGKQAGPPRPKEFQCHGCTAAGVAAAAGFTEVRLQFTEADAVNQSGEYTFSARWTKVMGTSEWKASRTRWFKGLKPTVILLSRGISNAESSRRAGQAWQRKGRLRSVVWARTKPPPPEYVHLVCVSTHTHTGIPSLLAADLQRSASSYDLHRPPDLSVGDPTSEPLQGGKK